MTTLKVTNLQTSAGVSNIAINANTGEVTLPNGLEPIINDRSNLSNVAGYGRAYTDELGPPLMNFNEVHYYETPGASLLLYTRMLRDAFYEFTYTSSGGAENTDFVLYPNGLTYGGQFQAVYRATQGSNGSFDEANQTLNHFYFDHQFGGDGNNSMGQMIMYTGNGTGADKMCFYFGADDGTNVSYGFNRWTNDSVENKRCWIRRLG